MLIITFSATITATNIAPYDGPYYLEPVIYEELEGACPYSFELNFRGHHCMNVEAILLHVYFNIEDSRGGYAHFWTDQEPTASVLMPMDSTQLVVLPPDTTRVEVSCASPSATGVFSANVYWIIPGEPVNLPDLM